MNDVFYHTAHSRYYGYIEDGDIGLIDQEREKEKEILAKLRAEEASMIDEAFSGSHPPPSE